MTGVQTCALPILECLSRFIVSGESISPCGIVRNPTSVREKLKEQLITQVGDGFTIEQRSTPARFIISYFNQWESKVFHISSCMMEQKSYGIIWGLLMKRL